MRAFVILLASVLASVGIGIGAMAAASDSAIGSSSDNPKTVAYADASSIGATPDVQLSVTVSDSSPISASQRGELAKLRVVISESSGSSTPLSSATPSQIGSDIAIDYGAQGLGEIRLVGGRAYLTVNLNELKNLPLKLSPTTAEGIAAAAPLLSGRWFVLPASALGKIAVTPPAGASGLSSAQRALFDNVARFHFVANSGSGNEVELSGTNAAIEQAIQGLVPSLSGGLAQRVGSGLGKGTVSGGSYKVDLSSSPNGVLDDVSASDSSASGVVMHVAISHDSFSVQAPAGAVPLPAGILRAARAALTA